MSQLPRDIEVEMTLLPTEHGGNDAPLVSGSRPQFYYAGADWEAQLTFIERDSASPGDSARAYVTLGNPEEHVRTLTPGMPFLLRYGQRVIAYGRVLSLIDLATSARIRGRLTSA